MLQKIANHWLPFYLAVIAGAVLIIWAGASQAQEVSQVGSCRRPASPARTKAESAVFAQFKPDSAKSASGAGLPSIA